MSEHTTTPGPWKVVSTYKDAQRGKYAVAPWADQSASIATTTGNGNAYLIAASPDLLDACRLALQLIRDNRAVLRQSTCKDDWPEDHGCGHLARTWEALETAIQKAGGSTHE